VFETVKPEMFTVSAVAAPITENAGTVPPPETVTTPAPGPVIVMFALIAGRALPRVMVPVNPPWNVIVLPGARSAAVMASRSEHVAVQPASVESARVVTVSCAEALVVGARKRAAIQMALAKRKDRTRNGDKRRAETTGDIHYPSRKSECSLRRGHMGPWFRRSTALQVRK
jgi:hypothetical protein